MEYITESLFRTSFTFSVADPYAVAHGLLHWAAGRGRLIERANRMFTSGPHTTAEVRFFVERDLDKFTLVRVAFDMEANISASELSAVIEATLECRLPPAHGVATATFRDLYLQRLWQSHLKTARDIAEELAESARRHLPVEVK